VSREPSNLPSGSDLALRWDLDPEVVFLNHGSFGACPRTVLAAQSELRSRMESEPVRFFIRELPELLDHARAELASFVGADTGGLAFVANATTGVNTALAALDLEPGDELVVTDHGYAACRNAVDVLARRVGAEVVVAMVPFPVESPEQVVETVVNTVSLRTKAAVLDHVTSPTGVVFPIRDLVAELGDRGVTVIVDGAHAPGMIDLGVAGIGAPFYTGNCHKWMCAPKGAAFLWVRDDWRERVRPLVISHGAAAPPGDRSRYHLEFDWTGTRDPTAWLAIPAAIATLAGMVDGGWPEIRARNRATALAARSAVCAALAIAPPCPEPMIGALAAVPLPDGSSPAAPPAEGVDPLQERLYRRFRIEVPVTRWSAPPRRAIRLSAQLYNTTEQFRYLASALGRPV
jgi:isopenicillin-N epimerase